MPHLILLCHQHMIILILAALVAGGQGHTACWRLRKVVHVLLRKCQVAAAAVAAAAAVLQHSAGLIRALRRLQPTCLQYDSPQLGRPSHGAQHAGLARPAAGGEHAGGGGE